MLHARMTIVQQHSLQLGNIGGLSVIALSDKLSVAAVVKPPGNHFQLQGDCTGRLVGGNSSPESCFWTQANCDQIVKGLQITAV